MTAPNDPIATINQLVTQQAEDERYLPKGPRPDVKAPDLLLFREVSSATDRALTDGFYRAFGHLFTAGDNNLYVYHAEQGSWSRDEAATQLLAYCVHLSDGFFDEMTAALAKAEDLKRNGNDSAAATLENKAAALKKLVVHCESAKTMGAVARLLTAKLKALQTSNPHTMNADTDVLACSNGVVNLHTGELRYATPKDYITRTTRCRYRYDADTSAWHAVVLQACGGNPRLADFLQVYCGYMATGRIREQCMLILWGAGRNGKNLIMDAVATALGDYAHALPSSYLEAMGSAAGMDNNMMFAMAQLDGVRMAYVSETGEKGKLKEAWVKSQTGDKKMRARLARENFYEFQITHKLVVGTNHKPEITGTDDGVWERIRLLGMGVRFGSLEEVEAGIAQQLMKTGLLDQFTTGDSREEVLKWVVDGAKKYLVEGLKQHTPAEISAQTKMYRREQDTLGQFLQAATDYIGKPDVDYVQELENAVGGDDRKTFLRLSREQQMRVEKQELWRIYTTWCDENGHFSMSATMFARRITGAQRFWQDDIGGETLMRSLEVVKDGQDWFYRYVRLSALGFRLRGTARAKGGMVSVEHGRRDDDDPPF